MVNWISGIVDKYVMFEDNSWHLTPYSALFGYVEMSSYFF